MPGGKGNEKPHWSRRFRMFPYDQRKRYFSYLKIPLAAAKGRPRHDGGHGVVDRVFGARPDEACQDRTDRH
jgi:hypothetical protein